MKEMELNNMPTKAMPQKSSKLAISAIIATLIMGLACIGAFLASLILVLDAIPFHHIFPH